MQLTGSTRNAVKQWGNGRQLTVRFVRKGNRTIGANFYHNHGGRRMTAADAKSLRRVVGNDYTVSAVNGTLRLK